MTKFFDIARMILPLLGFLVPGAAPILPYILDGITAAEAIPGASGADKKAHALQVVSDGAAAVTASGKLTIDPAAAVATATAVFSAVDNVKAIVASAQPTPTATPAA